MRFGDKEFSYYWKGIKWPVMILSAWYLAGLIVSKVALETYNDIFGNALVTYILPGLLFLVAGYLVSADCKGEQRQAVWAGALTGLLVSIIVIVIGIVQVNDEAYMNMTLEQAAAKAAASGQDIDMSEIPAGIMKIGIVIGLLLTPVINGLFGALFGWCGYFIAKHVC